MHPGAAGGRRVPSLLSAVVSLPRDEIGKKVQ